MAQHFSETNFSQHQTNYMYQQHHSNNKEQYSYPQYHQDTTNNQDQYGYPRYQDDASNSLQQPPLPAEAEAAFPRIPQHPVSMADLQHPPPGDAPSPDIKIHWYHPSLMVLLWLAGLCFAIGHHAYYASMNGTDSHDQQWVIRLGTGFAFLVKACFSASLGIAIKQLVWAMLRRRFTSLRGIDALFSITTDPTSLFLRDIWLGMPGLALLGVLLWAIPLAVVVTPAAISVTTVAVNSTQSCDIPVLNFEKEFDWTFSTPQLALANYNETVVLREAVSAYNSEEHSNHTAFKLGYGGPTPVIEKLLRRVLIGQEILPFSSVCGPNCTYTTTTPGMGYKCSRISSNSEEAAYVNSTWRSKDLAISYVGVLLNSRELIAVALQQEKFIFDMEYFKCEPYRVSYRLNVTFENGIRRLQVLEEESLERVSWPMFSGNRSLSATYKETNFWGYQALADLVGQHFQGEIWMPQQGEGGQVTTTTLSYSSLVGAEKNLENPNETVYQMVEFPKPGFRQGLVDLVRNISISLLADPHLYVYDTKPGLCETSLVFSVWRYDPRALWIAYGAICLVCTAGVAIGAVAMRLNGCSSDVSFSRILCTTRNATLDHATAGSRFGAHPLGEKLEKLPLMFGELSDQGHVGFGVEGQVVELARGRCDRELA